MSELMKPVTPEMLLATTQVPGLSIPDRPVANSAGVAAQGGEGEAMSEMDGFTVGETISFDNIEDMMAMRPSGVETPWHWLSFADPTLPAGSQFLGVCIVQAGHFMGALSAANLLGINPGGEAQGVEIPPEALPDPSLRNRLLSMGDLEAAGLI